MLGARVSPCVLDVLSKTLHTWADVALAMLKDIDSYCELGDYCTNTSHAAFSICENGLTADELHLTEEQVASAGNDMNDMSDIYILIEMLSIPCLAVEASQVFERAVARGAFGIQSVGMVLEHRHSQRMKNNSNPVANNSNNTDFLADGKAEPLHVQEDDFTPVLGLAEALALSRNSQVQEFVRMLFSILFKMYVDEGYRGRLLKGLVDRANNATDNYREVDLYLDILVFLVQEEEVIVRPVLSMMREVAELANVDRAALWHQLCASEDENIRIREERQTEHSNFAREKTILSQRLSESEATNSRLKVLNL